MTQPRAVTALSGHASIGDVVAIADRAVEVSVEPSAHAAVAAAQVAADELSAPILTYGRTTGVGANRLTVVADTGAGHGTRLLRSHAVDAGNPLPDRTMRAMLAVRLNQLCVPGAGLDPSILTGRGDASAA